MASSSAEAVAAAAATASGWGLPETDGDVRVPWLALVVGHEGPIELLAMEGDGGRLDGPTNFEAKGRTFAARAAWSAPDDAGARDVELAVTSLGDAAVDASIGVGLRLAGTSTPWLLIPGLFYGENRPAECRRLFPRWQLGAADAARFVSDRWAFRSDRAATPLVLASDGRWTVALMTAETSEVGTTGLAFAADGASTDIGLFFPYHEQPVVYDGSDRPRPGAVAFHRFAPGETCTLRYRVYAAGPERFAFAPILRDAHARLASASPVRPWVSSGDAAALAAEGLLRWHYHADEGAIFETAAFERAGDGVADVPGDRAAMHVAWLSGIPTAFALILHGRRTARDAAVAAGTRVIDNIATHLAPAGTFWGQWTRAGGWGKGWAPGVDAVHARTLGEAALFLGRVARLEGGFNVRHPEWDAALRANLAFAAGRQRDDGALGSAYDARTGGVLAWTGAAGLAWVPALVEGARQLDVPAWLEAARAAGAFYASFVDAAFIHGAPEDVDLAPSSEDGYVALMAYVALMESATDEEERSRWRELARKAAEWMLTFRYAYDVAFEPTTLLATYRYASRGADQASPANQHLHVYGLICTPELVRLGRALGDGWYGTRAAEHFAAARQFIARSDGDFNARRGMAPERLYQTDCFGPKGAIGPLSHAWVLGLLLYASEVARDLPELADG